MALKVKIWGQDVGFLVWDQTTNSARFRYEDNFRMMGVEISPIHLKASPTFYSFPGLPFASFKGLPGVFADSLPDRFGEGLMNSYFKNKDVSFADLTPLDRLAYIGARGMGAIEYHPAREVQEKRSRISIDELEQLAAFGVKQASKLTTHLEPDRAEGFQDILSIGTSAGGARAKAVIAWNEATGEIRSGQLEHGPGFKHWLIKLDVGAGTNHLGDSAGFGRIEYAYFQMAKDAGVRMQDCRLMEENGRGHFMTARFDRQHGSKQHIHTLCGIRHFDYEDVSSHTYAHLFETARYLKLPYPDMEQLYRQMVFNVLGVNCDDHTKNFSFLLDQNKDWRAAPAYDVCYSYDPGNPWVNSNMAVNGKKTGITKKDLISEGKKNSIMRPEAIIDQVAEVVSRWPDYARASQVNQDFVGLIQSRIEERLKRLATGQSKGQELDI
ncbi:MAG: type II toxin-antitoxin system HipA family toxin [Imperialibacter sp.]|uniref:type II toxin-antitoxin system HipA family toxin n=1 Tax=Imperialibacter sp. TaxID=2038411 RepID=UPI0032EC5824